MATKDIEPDLILMNGRIATQDERRSFAQAVAIQDGRFAAVGSNEQIMALRGAKTEVIDLGGRTVIPGLNDSHMHPIRGGLNYNMELRWDGVPSLADALRMLQGASAAHAAAAVGARGRRLDRVSIRRAAHADARRNQPRRARHAGVRAASLRSRFLEWRGLARRRLHAKTRLRRSAAKFSATSKAIPPGLLIARPNASILYSTLGAGTEAVA